MQAADAVTEQRYTAERGEVLLWLQGVLLRELQHEALTAWLPARSRPPATPPSVRAAQPAPTLPPPAPTPRTFGAGSPSALAVDVAAEGRAGRTFALVEVLVELPEPGPSEAMEPLLAVVAEAARQILRKEDGVSRTGPAAMALLLQGTEGLGAEIAAARLEARAHRLASARGLPRARFRSQALDRSAASAADLVAG